MVLYYKNGIRAGITWAICHCTEGNNKYIYVYDETNESSCIVYFDFNNQYERDLSEPLHYSEFEYIEDTSMHAPQFIIH